MSRKISGLIVKWENKHSEMLRYYNDMKKLSENERLFLRSEMKNALEFIEDLKSLKGENDV